MGRPLRARPLPDRSQLLGEPKAPPVPHSMKIIRQYAITNRQGSVLMCKHPHRTRLRLMCYPTQAAAETCSKRLEELGNDPQGAYPCDRGDHWHLSRELA